MRCLSPLPWILLVAALTAPGLAAQGSMAKIFMKDGTTVVGIIQRESQETIVLLVGDEVRVVKLRDVEDLEPVAQGSVKPGVYRPVVPPATGTPPPATPLVEAEVGAEDVGAATLDEFFDPRRGPSQWVERYLWGVPLGASARISLALGLWLFLGCIVHLSTRAVGLTNTSMVRAQLIALVVVVIAAIQAIVPSEGLLQMVAFVGLDVALWLLVTHLVYQSGIVRGCVMLLCASFLVLTTLLCLSGARFLVGAVQNQSL
jgi:hypothetical protein